MKRLKFIAIYGLACLVLAASASTFADPPPDHRYYVSTVFSWWPTYSDLSLYRKFVDGSKQKGMNAISVDIPWTVEDSSGKFDFAEPDQRIDYAVSRGLSVFIRVNTTTLGGRTPQWESTVADQKANNIHAGRLKSEAEYCAVRDARDRTLPMPKLILHALQVNINGGRLPEPEANGTRYLKIPLDRLTGAPWD